MDLEHQPALFGQHHLSTQQPRLPHQRTHTFNHALARGASAAAGHWPDCPTRAGGASQCACPAGFKGGYPACSWSATAQTGATSTAKDVRALAAPHVLALHEDLRGLW